MPWLIKKPASASSEIVIALTPLDGKVFATQRKARNQKEQRKAIKDPQQVLAEDLSAKAAKEEKKAKAAAKALAKGKGKSKGRGKATNRNGDEVADATKETEEVVVNGPDGIVLSRPKLFLDCLIMAIRSALKAARSKHGLPLDFAASENADPETPFTYSDIEIPILKTSVRAGLHFALQSVHMINGKVHKKWSSLRPALQAQIISSYAEALMD